MSIFSFTRYTLTELFWKPDNWHNKFINKWVWLFIHQTCVYKLKCFKSTFTGDPKWTQPVWNLKPLWNVVPFTWQFTWRFHCGNFPNNSKTLLHMYMSKWYLLINANLMQNRCCAIDCFLNNSSKTHAH